MKTGQDYLDDLTRIRSIMEKSTRFDSLSGVSGMLVGIYALIGSLVVFRFADPQLFTSLRPEAYPGDDLYVVLSIAVLILMASLGTVIFLSRKKARKRGEKVWNALTRRIVALMAVPLVSGGILILILSLDGLTGLMVPLSLIFYGIALCGVSRYTYEILNFGGFAQIVLGLLAVILLDYSLWIWALGFGVVNIILGYYLYRKHEK